MNRLAAEKDFAKILESKCELNFKIAKILTNAVGWRINFNSFRQGKQTLMIPARKYVDKEKAQADAESKRDSKKGQRVVEDEDGADKNRAEETENQLAVGESLEKKETLDLPQLGQNQTIDLDKEDEAFKSKRTQRAKLMAEKQKALKEEQLAQELALQQRTAQAREKILTQEEKMRSIENQITSQMGRIGRARADVKAEWEP